MRNSHSDTGCVAPTGNRRAPATSRRGPPENRPGKPGVPQRHTRRRLVLALVLPLAALLALGCSHEELQTFSRAVRGVPEHTAVPTVHVPTLNQTIVQSAILASPVAGCVQMTRVPAVGAFFQARLQNTCNAPMHVLYGYRTRVDGALLRVPWCTAGHAGLRSATTTIHPWQSQAIAPQTYGVLDQVFWCACNAGQASAPYAEPIGLGLHDCQCRCAPT